MNDIALQHFIVEELRSKLPVTYYYHNVQHTIEVIKNVTEMALIAQLPDEQLLQLKTAALMHDTGLMFARENHEDHSVKYLQKTLPQYGFALDSIEIISALVMATKMPQQPQSFLAQLLCDADLDYLGSKSYFMKSQQLRLEWLEENLISDSLIQWYTYQVEFLSSHTYFTQIARNRRQKGKENNLENLRTLLSK